MSAVTVAKPADITAVRLQHFAPRCDYMGLAPQLDAAAKASSILTARQVRHWLAQAHHESQGFTRLEEDLGYTAVAMCATWPAHFGSLAAADKCVGNPKALAAVVYGGRMGNLTPADAYTYRGRGFLQLTGRSAYRAAGQRLLQPYEQQPQLVGEFAGAAATAADFWRAHALNQVLASHPDEVLAANAVRRVINGGLNGIEDVVHLVRLAGTIWRD